MTEVQTEHREAESGNVLFLILIAVALFAALSYAVTQSTRSGAGSTDGEKNLLNSAALTQYPASLRTAVVRMILGGLDVDALAFDNPGNFPSVTNTDAAVFHPSGGGAVYQEGPPDMMVGGTVGPWYFNGNFQIPQIGQEGAGGNDLIAFLPSVTQGICEKVNEELGVTVTDATPTYSGIPEVNITEANISNSEVEGDTFPTTLQESLNNADGDLAGQPAGCFYEPGLAKFVFYSVLLER